ncbi:magnesium chelatase domain-containing protein [Actinomadura sp. 9N215]|uniref:magnesium chelatase domain-containing protein n=1 Tax=Actinomadura sp. 9N215 TaxID=3375150 RepID=UPI00379ACED0
MGLARTRAIALLGIEGTVVDVEASITEGTPGLHLIGLPDTARNQIRDRVYAAIINSDQHFPHRHVAVSLFPISLPKHGSGFDLAISVAVLAANGAVPAEACTGTALIGELGLDGRGAARARCLARRPGGRRRRCHRDGRAPGQCR